VSIIGDALQRAEQEGAPLDAPRPATPERPPRPVLNVSPRMARPAAVAAPKRTGQTIAPRAQRRVSAATFLLIVLAVLTVYMLADSRWSGHNWDLAQLWPPVAPMDDPASNIVGAASSPTQSAASIASERSEPPAIPQSVEPIAIPEASPAATTDAPMVESRVAHPFRGGVEMIDNSSRSIALPDPAGRFALSGVMLGGSTRLAVINGAIVEVGQTIDGAEVLAISRRDVSLSVSGKKLRIALQPAGSTRTPKLD
jgi:hypothetical protein